MSNCNHCHSSIATSKMIGSGQSSFYSSIFLFLFFYTFVCLFVNIFLLSLDKWQKVQLVHLSLIFTSENRPSQYFCACGIWNTSSIYAFGCLLSIFNKIHPDTPKKTAKISKKQAENSAGTAIFKFDSKLFTESTYRRNFRVYGIIKTHTQLFFQYKLFKNVLECEKVSKNQHTCTMYLK